MTWLVALVIAVAWGVFPKAHDPFLLPKTLLWVVGTVAVLFAGVDRPAGPWKNRGVAWVAGIVTLEMAARFYGTIIFWNPQDPNIPFLWFCVLPTVFVLLGLLFVMTCATRLLPPLAHRVRLTRVLCGVAVSVAVYALVQRVDLDQFLQGTHIPGLNLGWEYRVHPALFMIAALGNAQYTAMYVTLVLPLFLLFKSPRALLGLAVVLTAILLTGRRYALFLSGFSLLSYGWIRLWWTAKQKARPLGLLALGLLGVVGVGRLGWPLLVHDERWPIWHAVWAQWRQQPLTGHGLGAFPLDYFVNWETTRLQFPQLAVNSRWAWAHNDALQWLLETGLVGMTALGFTVASTLRRAWPRTRTVMGAGYYACFLTLLASSLVYFPWHFAPTACVGLVIWAMCETTEDVA